MENKFGTEDNELAPVIFATQEPREEEDEDEDISSEEGEGDEFEEDEDFDEQVPGGGDDQGAEGDD